MNYRSITAIAIAIVMGIAGLSLVGCPDNTGSGDGSGDGSGGDTTVPDTTAPAQVTGLTQARSADSASVILSWENPADTDVETIRIIATSSLPRFPLELQSSGASMSQSETITGLDAAADYTFTLFTIDAAGNPSASSGAPTVTASAVAVPTGPAQVTGLTQRRSPNGASVTLSWKNPTDPDVETIRIAVVPALPTFAIPRFPLELQSSGASMSQSQTVAGLDPAIRYTFIVLTIDGEGNISASLGAPTVVAFVDSATDTTPPAQVTGLTQRRSPNGTSVTLSWKNPANTDLANIAIISSPTLPTLPDSTLLLVASGASRSQSETITGVDATTEYTFIVFTVDKTGNYSAVSDAPMVTVPVRM